MDSWNTTQMVHQRLMIVFYGPPIGVKTCRVRSETNGTRACNDSVQLAPALRPAAAENSSCIHVFRFVYTNKLRVSAVMYVPSVCAVSLVLGSPGGKRCGGHAHSREVRIIIKHRRNPSVCGTM